MGFSIIAADGSSGGTTVVSTGAFPVSSGFGPLFGSEAGAVPRDIIFDGGLRAIHPQGKTQSPIYYTEPSETVVAYGVVDANATTSTLISILGGMEEVEFTRVSFRKFTTPDGSPSPTITGGLYTALPVGSVWSDAAAIIPNGTTLGGFSGNQTKRVDCTQNLRKPTMLYYRPGTRGVCTFEVSVWGMPKWALNHIKPK